MTASKKKIAVLGSGPASLAAVYELTSYPKWQEHYEITVYQMGWRLGGKVATGRGPKQRIEEHGIHIAQGWYNNTFRLIEDAFKICKENNLTPASPFQKWQDAFDRENTTLLTHYDRANNKWIKKNIVFPTNDLVPGQGGQTPLSVLLKEVIELIIEMLLGSKAEAGMLSFLEKEKEAAARVRVPSWMQGIVEEIKSLHKDKPGHLAEVKYLHHAADLMEKLKQTREKRGKEHLDLIKIIVGILELVHEGLVFLFEGLAKSVEKVYWLFVMIEFGLVNMIGILKDVYDPATGKLDFTRINHLDYRAWLKSHKATVLTLESALTRFLYTGTFHNLSGTDGQGRIAAGVALNFLTLAGGYKGSFVWKFKGGTADTMISPIFKVLEFRGVKFKFFHKTEQVHYSDTGDIEEITMGEQVTLKKDPYRPTYQFKGLDVWPTHPLYEQIDDKQAEKLQKENIDLEMAWSPWKNVATKKLKKGVDFDYVILGIPINVLGGPEGICREIIAKKEPWKKMVENVSSTPTMAMQLWLKPTLKELGMDLAEWGIPGSNRPNLVVYANPMYSWVDQSLVLPYEDWGAEEPGLLVYYTGTMTDPQTIPNFSDYNYPKQQLERVIRVSQQWLRDNMGWFFPNATTPEYPAGMKFNIIIDPSGKATADYAYLKSQHFRANVNPTDRYTLSLPGTNQYRLKADESGFDNLLLAGDWTDFGVNVGYYEGAIISGFKAAQALRDKLKLPADNPVFGEVEV